MLRDDLASETDPRKRARIRAQAVAQALTDGFSVTRGRYTLTVTGAPEMDGDRVRLYVAITRDGVDVTPPEVRFPEFIRLSNPPVWYPDPAGDEAVTSDVLDHATGKAVRVTERYRWDPAAVMRRELLDVLRGLTRGG